MWICEEKCPENEEEQNSLYNENDIHKYFDFIFVSNMGRLKQLCLEL